MISWSFLGDVFWIGEKFVNWRECHKVCSFRVEFRSSHWNWTHSDGRWRRDSEAQVVVGSSKRMLRLRILRSRWVFWGILEGTWKNYGKQLAVHLFFRWNFKKVYPKSGFKTVILYQTNGTCASRLRFAASAGVFRSIFHPLRSCTSALVGSRPRSWKHVCRLTCLLDEVVEPFFCCVTDNRILSQIGIIVTAWIAYCCVVYLLIYVNLPLFIKKEIKSGVFLVICLLV